MASKGGDPRLRNIKIKTGVIKRYNCMVHYNGNGGQ